MMLQKEHLPNVKRELAKVLAFATLFNATLLGNFISAPVAQADELPSVILNEVIPAGSNDKIELYSSDLAGEELSEGWQLSAGSAPFDLTGEFNEGGLLVVDLGNFFADNNATLSLTYNGINQDSVSWANNTAALLPAPASDKSLSRHSSLGWFSNTPETPDLVNSFGAELPVLPGMPKVLAGENNAEGYINNSSKNSVNAEAAGLNGQSVTIRFFDGEHSPIGETKTVSGGTATVSKDLTSLNDGLIEVRSFSRSGGIYSPWSAVGSATKDVVAPSSATFEDALIYANQSEAEITGSAENGSMVKFYSWNGVEAGEEVASVSGSTEFSALAPLATLNDKNQFVATVFDVAGNKSDLSDVVAVVHDNKAPAKVENLSAQHNLGFSSVTLEWEYDASEGCTLDCVASPIAGFNIYSSTTTSFSEGSKIGSVDQNTTSFTTSAFATGNRYFAVSVYDKAGNESDKVVSQKVLIAGLKSEKSANAGEAAVFGEQGLSLTPSQTATFTVVGYDNNLPGGEIPKGVSFIGNYFDVITDNDDAFPVNVKFYYTDAQLKAAGLTESQLQGIYFYDEATDKWMLYGDTGVSTANIAGTDYSGYVWANADHFTPIAIGGDNVEPADITRFQASSGNKSVVLGWSEVKEDAVGYIVRYRSATNKSDSTPYTEAYVSGASKTSLKIAGLQNGVLYEFRIWAVDAVGNESKISSVVVQTPGEKDSDDLVLPTKKPTSPTTDSGSKGQGGAIDNSCCIGGPVAQNPSGSGDTDDSNEKPSENDDDKNNDGEVNGDKDSEDGKNATSGSRALITFLIIIAAGAAGFGGYYAYQWWVDRPGEKADVVVKEKTETKKQKKHRRNRRW